MSNAVGKTYLEKGRPVAVLVMGKPRQDMMWVWTQGDLRIMWKRSPLNCLIRREDGTEVVRPFRGLRCPKDVTDSGR